MTYFSIIVIFEFVYAPTHLYCPLPHYDEHNVMGLKYILNVLEPVSFISQEHFCRPPAEHYLRF